MGAVDTSRPSWGCSHLGERRPSTTTRTTLSFRYPLIYINKQKLCIDLSPCKLLRFMTNVGTFGGRGQCTEKEIGRCPQVVTLFILKNIKDTV